MMATDPHHRPPADQDTLPSAVPQCGQRCDQQRWEPWRDAPGWDRPHIIIEAVTVMVCAPLTVALIVTVIADGWPVWWLVFAGMLGAWAGDSVWNLASHILTVLVARSRCRKHRAGHDQAHAGGIDGGRGGVHGDRHDRGQAGEHRRNDDASSDPR